MVLAGTLDELAIDIFWAVDDTYHRRVPLFSHSRDNCREGVALRIITPVDKRPITPKEWPRYCSRLLDLVDFT